MVNLLVISISECRFFGREWLSSRRRRVVQYPLLQDRCQPGANLGPLQHAGGVVFHGEVLFRTLPALSASVIHRGKDRRASP